MSFLYFYLWTLVLSSFPTAESRTVTSTITSTIIATATATGASSGPSSSSFASDTEFRSSILNSTNFYRAQHNATALTWNQSLATYAATYAEKCLWKHSHGPSGENLASSFANTTSAIEAWGNERRLYDFGRPTGFSDETGHFTQLVWKDTRSLGCGRFLCNGTSAGDTDGGDDEDKKEGEGDGERARGWFVVCEYWPPGNVQGEFGNEVQAQTQTGRRKLVLGTPSGSARTGTGGLGMMLGVLGVWVVGAGCGGIW